ncbi:MAG: O-antigen ligase family protein [Anaerosomatales bacterium]|nr:O-antigen ligase family protein [Anaerosomatales bacterium]
MLEASTSRRTESWWPWVPVGLTVGLASAAIAAVLPADWVLWVVGGLATGGFAAAVLWRTEVGIGAMIVANALRDSTAIITEPFVVNAFHVALILTALSWGLRVLAGARRAAPRLTLLEIALAAPVLAGLWSLAASTAPLTTLQYTGRLLLLWLFALVVSRHVTTRAATRRLLALFCATAAALALLAIAQYFAPDIGIGLVHSQRPSPGVVLYRPAGFYLDPNFLGGHLSIAALVGLGYALHEHGLKARLYWAAGGALSAAGMLVTYSRTAWIGFAVGIVFLALTAPRGPRRMLVTVGVLGALAVLVISPASVVNRVTSLFDPSGDSSLATRYHMYASSVEMIEDNWAFGVGLERFEAAYPPYRRLPALARIQHPHQVPLALIAETGIMGLAAQALLLYALVAAVRRRYRQGWSPTDTVLLAGMLTLLVESLFQYYLYFELLWLVAALIAAPADTTTGGMSHE